MRVDDIVLSSMFDRAIVPPYGLEDGEDGATFEVYVQPASGEIYRLPGKANVRLKKGDVVIMDSSGGGGFGK